DADQLSRLSNESCMRFALADVGQCPTAALANLAIPLSNEDLASRAMHVTGRQAAAVSLEESGGFLARSCVGMIERNPDRYMTHDKDESEILDARLNTRARLERVVREESDLIGDFDVVRRILVRVMVVFPLLWVVSAFIFRGGIILRLMGMVLLRANGQRALRVQCAWRAFVTWLPPTALLLLAVWLDISCWKAWAATDHPGKWLEAGAWASWFGALLLLPLYFLVALRYPARGPHDRLAGTYLLPR